MSSTATQAGPERSPARRMAAPAAGLLATAAVWAGVAVVGVGGGGPSFCPWRSITGLDCPFCGATRSAAALAHGDLLLALDHNALFVLVVLPLAAVAWLAWAARAWQGREPAQVPTRLLVGLLALTGAWWILRLAVPWLGSPAA